MARVKKISVARCYTTFAVLFKSYTLLSLALILCLSGCTVDRPPGYLTIGKLSEYSTKTQFLPEKNLYLVRRGNGLAVMSTLCTYDRLPLKLEGNEAEGNKRFVSPYNGSVYSLQGEKISGPTRSPLKYYRLVIDSGVYGGPKDTLYVRIGDEVSPEWQLQP